MKSICEITESPEETEALAAEFARQLLKQGETDAFLALYGDLGAGKTAFIRGLASVLTPDAAVCSPTYTVVNEYEGNGVRLCHFDMYRIASEDDLYSIGFYEYQDCVMAVEWSEHIPFALPDHYYRIEIRKTAAEGEIVDCNKRMVKIEETNNEDSGN